MDKDKLNEGSKRNFRSEKWDNKFRPQEDNTSRKEDYKDEQPVKGNGAKDQLKDKSTTGTQTDQSQQNKQEEIAKMNADPREELGDLDII